MSRKFSFRQNYYYFRKSGGFRNVYRVLRDRFRKKKQNNRKFYKYDAYKNYLATGVYNKKPRLRNMKNKAFINGHLYYKSSKNYYKRASGK